MAASGVPFSVPSPCCTGTPLYRRPSWSMIQYVVARRQGGADTVSPPLAAGISSGSLSEDLSVHKNCTSCEHPIRRRPTCSGHVLCACALCYVTVTFGRCSASFVCLLYNCTSANCSVTNQSAMLPDTHALQCSTHVSHCARSIVGLDDCMPLTWCLSGPDPATQV